MHHSSIRGVEDMSTLEDLHDGAIMHNLFLRYQQRHVYVSVAQLQTNLHLETEQNLPAAIGTPGAQSRCWFSSLVFSARSPGSGPGNRKIVLGLEQNHRQSENSKARS